uniref:DeoR/GlpR family DNA-binding transcription regulator n=1 Tax=Pararhizobium sp. IMCC3301 TaxID=3067904 RepID=UPI00274176D2|nr:DeoR/GlpR family DNA-binding transcription regulator [Pararhizobium sp. IMCC3301]
MRAAAKLHATQRHSLILQALDETGFVTVPEMATACNVSEMTMRRDLDFLSENRRLERTHGGAARLDSKGAVMVDLVEPNIDARSVVNSEGKSAIARSAADLIQPHQTIALDIGTTTLSLASILLDRDINIYTSSLKIAGLLAGKQPSVFVPGGRIFGSEPSVVGPQAVRCLNDLCFDLVFIGASGVTDAGFYDYSLEDTHIKRALIEGAQKVVALIDSTKFDRMSVAKVCALKEVDLLVTDEEPPQPLLETLKAAGVTVQLAK